MPANKGSIPWNKGIKLNYTVWMKGKKHTQAAKDKVSVANKGKVPWNKGKKTGLVPRSAYKKGDNVGERNHAWRGDDASYAPKHKWVYKVLGRPLLCEFCGKNGGNHRGYHWSNKNHEYKREVKDWQRLCVSCHKKYDIKMNKTSCVII